MLGRAVDGAEVSVIEGLEVKVTVVGEVIVVGTVVSIEDGDVAVVANTEVDADVADTLRRREHRGEKPHRLLELGEQHINLPISLLLDSASVPGETSASRIFLFLFLFLFLFFSFFPFSLLPKKWFTERGLCADNGVNNLVTYRIYDICAFQSL
jgi:hypothetical protein